MTSYSIDTKSLLQRHHNDTTAAINELVTAALSGSITFPFRKYYAKTADELFIGLQKVTLQVSRGTPFRLFSYFPRYNSYLPPQFRGSPTIISSTEKIYWDVDVLSDIFLEDVRLQAKRFDQPLSVHDAWRDREQVTAIMATAIKQPLITPMVLREAIYNTIAETKAFNPSWAKALLELVVGQPLAGKKWLDISAGLGDRLLTAMALNMDYVGYDPNTMLQAGHSEMIKRFGNNIRHRVIYEPFEKATIPTGPYDVSLVSPPFFTIEEYVAGQREQSIVNYPDYDQWMVWFLFASLSKVWDNLKIGGYLILHLGDNKEIVTAEAANIFIENYLPGASWEGVIGMQSEAKRARPVWVWRKVALNDKRQLWEPTRPNPTTGPLSAAQRTLFRMFPELHAELLRFYTNKYAPNYTVRRSNAKIIRDYAAAQQVTIPLDDDLAITALLAEADVGFGVETVINRLTTATSLPQLAATTAYYTPWLTNATTIREHVAIRLPGVPSAIINTILADNVMLTSLLETLGEGGTITWSIAMIKLAVR